MIEVPRFDDDAIHISRDLRIAILSDDVCIMMRGAPQVAIYKLVDKVEGIWYEAHCSMCPSQRYRGIRCPGWIVTKIRKCLGVPGNLHWRLTMDFLCSSDIDYLLWRASLRESICEITNFIGDRELSGNLEADLNKSFPLEGTLSQTILKLCAAGVTQGWIQYTQIGSGEEPLEPFAATHGFQVKIWKTRAKAGRRPKGLGDGIELSSSSAWRVYQGKRVFPKSFAGRNPLILSLVRSTFA